VVISGEATRTSTSAKQLAASRPFGRHLGFWHNAASRPTIVETINNGVAMATVNFSVPDEIKEAFNATFADANKSAIIADLMREAVEREQRRQASQAASVRIRSRRREAPVRSAQDLAIARDAGRS
jgi:hypothetical protein